MQDAALVLSDKQAITSSVASQNFINEGAAFNTAEPMIAEIRINTTFSGSGTLTVAIEASPTEDFSTKEIIAVSRAVPAAQLVAGNAIRLPIAFNSNPTYCYIRAYYTASSAFSAGKVTTVIQPRTQTNGVVGVKG